MREIPDCLNRRYKALDELIKELSSAMMNGAGGSPENPSVENNSLGIKLMCDFWNILKDDPDCNLKEEVQQCMGVESHKNSGVFGPQRVECFVARKEQLERDKRDPMNRITHICCDNEPKVAAKKFCGGKPSQTPSIASDKIPLSKVLCNLKEAASFDKKCNVRVGELVQAQKDLTEQIQILEQREREGAKLLKQADCMWSCMEDTYKKKVAESIERQKILLKQLKDVEASSNKWRKNKKDLEFQLANINKCQEEIIEKQNQKANDITVMDIEIDDLKKRIESNLEDVDIAKNSLKTKRDASDVKMANINAEMAKLQKRVDEQQRIKAEKLQEGTKYVKEAREDLQKICRVLLQKKLENEDLRAEKQALLEENDLLRNTCETCKDKCKARDDNLVEELKNLDAQIAEFKNKCIRCHECTDTQDVRKFCSDCPRCIAERECLYEGDHCSPDHSLDCVCMSVKQKFLDNVFDNMYTVLERQAKTCPGKAVADAVLNCLKRSRNGKLNEETRKILQDFILTTVKKNLNLTIVGGAVKTRCEMDPDTYKQLMLCLKEVNVTRPTKEDKGTGAKKESCRRWGGPSECNCPKGPKACICTKKAPPPPHDPTPCGPPDKEDIGEVKACPYKKNAACGPDCGMQGYKPGAGGLDVAAWRPDPCQAQSCPFSKNMRAAQCVLGPEPLVAVPNKQPTLPNTPVVPDLEKMTTCTCGEKPDKPCPCHRDRRSQPRQRIIEEVMGRYTEVSPIEKVASEHEFGESNSTRRLNARCDCANLPMKYLLASNISDNKISRFCACSSNYVPREGRKPFVEKLRKKGHVNICRSSKSANNTSLHDRKLLSDVGFESSQKNNILRNKSDNDIKVILCPKFPHIYDDKLELSLGTSNMLTSESTHLRLKYKSSLKSAQGFDSCDASFVERKVCETVKELLKDIVVPEVPSANNQSSSDVEWVTLESLFKEITSLTKLEELSSDTVNEVEVKCETLEASKDFKLLQESNVHEVSSMFYSINTIEILHDNISDQEKISNSVNLNGETSSISYSNEERNSMAEEVKSKLLDNIRQTYNISVETSLDSFTVKDQDLSTRKLKLVRKCLRNLNEATLEQTECNCVAAKRQKKDEYNINYKKTRKFFHYEKPLDKRSNSSEIDNLRKCLLAMSTVPIEELHLNDSMVKNTVRNNVCNSKHNKLKTLDKKYKRE